MTKAALPRTSPLQVLGTLAALTLVGVLGVAGTTAALSDTTDNSLNQFDAGEIDLSDNDAGSFLYDVDNQEPGDVVEKCVKVSYTGTAGSTVALYQGTPVGDVGPYVAMTVEAPRRAPPSTPTARVSSPRSRSTAARSRASRPTTAAPRPG